MAAFSVPRVVHISSAHSADDPRIFHKECATLAAAEFDVHLIAHPSASPNGGHSRGVHIHSLAQRRGRLERIARTVPELRRAALRLGGDIYHFHDPELIPFGLELRARGKHVIYDVHEDLPAAIVRKPYLPAGTHQLVATGARLVEAAMARTATAIVAATPSIARRFPGDKTTIVHNFPFSTELRAKFRQPFQARARRVLYSGGISLQRGAVQMVEAVGRSRSGARLCLIGRFDRSATEERVGKLKGWDRVDALGWQPRQILPTVHAESRAGLVLFHPEPNHIEALPTKLFEYMSAGLPVIASDFPLWREIVEFSGCGVLVDPFDVGAIAEAIDWLIENPAEAEAMGRRGQAAVDAMYNWDREGTKLVELYRRISP